MSSLVIGNARLLEPAGMLVAGSLVIDGDRITALLDEPFPTGPRSAEVCDVGGRTVMPGMVSCHFHSTYDELGSQPAPLGSEHPPAYQALIAARNLHTALRHGYTSAVSAGAANDIDRSMKLAIDRGLIPGPRFVPGSRELSTTGHSNDTTPWYWRLPEAGGIRLCDGAEGFRLGVREEIKRGAQVVKLFVTGGHGTLAPKERTELTREELAAAIDAAHARGALIRGHIANKEAILLSVELGIDVIDHADDMDDECIERLVDAGTYVVPSAFFPKHFAETVGSGLGFADSMLVDVERACEVLPKANAAGVRLLVGDDYGALGFPHGLYGRELSFYVDEVGIPPSDVLAWATRNGAALMGRQGELGEIRVGALADLLVVDGDPLADIGVLADPGRITVVKGGEVVAGSL